jgi:hypothetical protein
VRPQNKEAQLEWFVQLNAVLLPLTKQEQLNKPYELDDA